MIFVTEARWLCTVAIIDLQFRELNARSSFLERNRMKSDLYRGFTLYMYLFHGHYVLWKLESAGTTTENLSPQNNKEFEVEVQCVYLSQCNWTYESYSAQVNFRAIV